MWQSLWNIGYYSVLGLIILVLALRAYFTLKRRGSKKLVLGIFHPYCNDGGGGERVLWCLIKAVHNLQSKGSQLELVVYTGDRVPASDILKNVEERFGITFTSSIRFVRLQSRTFVEKKWYPRFTMIGQSLGSMIVGLEGLFRACPDVFLDTMGYSFTFPIFRFLGGCWVGCYVHYPTISTDMFNKVAVSTADFNNDKAISQSNAKTQAKLLYYSVFGFLYKMMGKCSQLTMVNSSWTRNHIRSIWNPSNLHLVFPPVDCAGFRGLPLSPRYLSSLPLAHSSAKIYLYPSDSIVKKRTT